MQILGPIVRGIKHNLRAFCKRNSFADNPVSVDRHFFALQVKAVKRLRSRMPVFRSNAVATSVILSTVSV